MWNFVSKCLAGNSNLKLRNGYRNIAQDAQDSSDDESASTIIGEDGLECPICCESFNIVENIPYVLWCGHSLCKNCILGLQWAVLKIPPLPIQLPLLISCPWCNLLSPRIVYKGNMKFPRKNYFLLWMVERMNDDVVRSHDDYCEDCNPIWPAMLIPRNRVNPPHIRSAQSSGTGSNNSISRVLNRHTLDAIRTCFSKLLLFLVELIAKFPLVLIFLLIVLYVIPASAAILVLYVLLTILFAIPSFLVLYFAYPSLDWLVREIIA